MYTDMRLLPDSARWLAGSADPAGSDAAVRVFCFAHAGGGSAIFRPWRSLLGPGVEVCPVVLPGRESRVRELPYRRMEQLLDPLCQAIEPYLDRPFAFLGHSLGSIIAFEVARRFPPAGLVVSGRRAPRLATARRLFSSLPDGEFLTAIGHLGGTPPEVLRETQLIRMMMPALRADFELNEAYAVLPGPRLGCPLIAYVGVEDPEVSRAELLAWQEETTGEFTMRVFRGGHFYLKGDRGDDRSDVTSALRQDLARVFGFGAQP
ncbi:thioesterase II family protein [Dactylosporangium matsuzakiense]|uniref:Thioesterase n=1 Tax=Dactylosporangium matsuzakiense TaxID=53360 RepID=A0A9W6KTT2_9ACTN|nr:alpha/beta fold hydrolase [Dactylosporangium matsuzakiense]GLL05334.1 thioesterase [Dactylosporangium matsuzakiense]